MIFEAIMLLLVASLALVVAFMVEPKAFASEDNKRQEEYESRRFFPDE